ncbi:MAG: GTPase [Alphaproteobacteria bacterium]|nr:GTPase [Alphaproteobacteria bacterium]
MAAEPTRIVIMGAAGRDFHNFNVVYRDDPAAEVVAFTATQIPGIAGRRYPPELAGPRYPDGIPIVAEDELAALIRSRRIDRVVFAYSDVTHEHVMHRASVALAAGADFILLGPDRTMLRSRLPVIAVCAVRTGVGKSQVTRYIARLLKARGLRAAVVRHPMPYGDLTTQAVQRFETPADLDRAQCTVEEREEYEPHIAIGNVVFAGVDYGKILQRIEAEADVVLWDGGNNDFSFYRPDLHIVLVDPMRAGHEMTHHPGEAVLRMADAVLVAKCNSAAPADIAKVAETASRLAPGAAVVRGASKVTLDQPARVNGKRVLVIEDGPTVTHGGMAHGAGFVAATEAGAAAIVDPRPAARGRIAEVFAAHPHIGRVVPAMGYSEQELIDLAATIDGAGVDVAVAGTPADLGRLVETRTPIVRARYEFEEIESPGLQGIVMQFLKARAVAPRGERR